MMDEDGYLHCTSCMIGSKVPLGHSHNLPKGKYPLLETDPENISLRCQDMGFHKGCHNALDSGDFAAIAEFEDLDDIMAYRKKTVPIAYNQMVTGLRSVGCMTYPYLNI